MGSLHSDAAEIKLLEQHPERVGGDIFPESILDDGDDATVGVETTKARAKRALEQPTRRKIDGHMVTPEPYREWFPVCVAGFGSGE